MTIYDIAQRAGVSASTVSRVLNGRPGIKASTREKVEKILKETNFSVSEAARGLVNKTSNFIGILVSDIRNQHHIEGGYMIEQYFMKKGYCSIIINAGESDESQGEYIKFFASRRVNAVVLIGSIFQCEHVRKMIEDYLPSIPVIFQNGFFDLANVSSALTDDARGAYMAFEYLYRTRGRRCIAYINNNDTPSNRLKLSGYKAAAKAFGQSPLIISQCEDSLAGGAEATRRLLELNPDVDGIIYAVDLIAVGGLRELRDLKKRVPEDISVFGTDNSPYSMMSYPRLSTIDSRLDELSVLCAQILEKAMEDPSYSEHRVVEPTLVIREST